MADPHLLRATHAPSFFGKLPCTLDFVRIHHDYPEAVELDHWLAASLQRLAAQGQRWPAEPLRFVFVPASSETALLGAVAASRDRAGRAFPIVIFAAFTPAADLGALPRASERFLQQAEDLLARSASLTAPDLKAALTRVQTPQPTELKVARERLQRELAELRLDAFARPLFAGDCAAAAAAFERLLDAVARGSRDLVLDCPVEMPRDCAVWSRLAALSFGREPSCLWNAGRMLLALGPLPERAPLYWVAKSRRHAQLCAVTAVDRREPAPGAAVSGDWPILRVFAELARRRM